MGNILVIGGTRFFGRKLVELLLIDGHDVAILTRGHAGNPFNDRVEHIIADRLNKQALASAIEGRYFDIVYDNICYSPNEAIEFCEIFNGKIGKLVFTSTLSTYVADGVEKAEADFNPYEYAIQLGDRNAFPYGEGKRLAEAVFYQHGAFPTVAVRFPMVVGEEDYTERLLYHVRRVQSGEPIHFLTTEAEMSFITADEAAAFLIWAGVAAVEGPFNATANGTISLAELIAVIENVTGNEANVVVGNRDTLSPYAIPTSWYMTNKKASDAGFTFSNLHDWLKPLIQILAK